MAANPPKNKKVQFKETLTERPYPKDKSNGNYQDKPIDKSKDKDKNEIEYSSRKRNPNSKRPYEHNLDNEIKDNTIKDFIPATLESIDNINSIVKKVVTPEVAKPLKHEVLVRITTEQIRRQKGELTVDEQLELAEKVEPELARLRSGKLTQKEQLKLTRLRSGKLTQKEQLKLTRKADRELVRLRKGKLTQEEKTARKKLIDSGLVNPKELLILEADLRIELKADLRIDLVTDLDLLKEHEPITAVQRKLKKSVEPELDAIRKTLYTNKFFYTNGTRYTKKILTPLFKTLQDAIETNRLHLLSSSELLKIRGQLSSVQNELSAFNAKARIELDNKPLNLASIQSRIENLDELLRIVDMAISLQLFQSSFSSPSITTSSQEKSTGKFIRNEAEVAVDAKWLIKTSAEWERDYETLDEETKQRWGKEGGALYKQWKETGKSIEKKNVKDTPQSQGIKENEVLQPIQVEKSIIEASPDFNNVAASQPAIEVEEGPTTQIAQQSNSLNTAVKKEQSAIEEKKTVEAWTKEDSAKRRGAIKKLAAKKARCAFNTTEASRDDIKAKIVQSKPLLRSDQISSPVEPTRSSSTIHWQPTPFDFHPSVQDRNKFKMDSSQIQPEPLSVSNP